jgi:hypothetical protein
MKVRTLSDKVYPSLSRREQLDIHDTTDLKIHPVISSYNTVDKPLDDLIYEYVLIYGLSGKSNYSHNKGTYLDILI